MAVHLELWTAEEDASLLRLRDESKLTFGEISATFGGRRSRVAVVGRYYRITGHAKRWAKPLPKRDRQAGRELVQRACQRPAVRPHTTLTGRLMGDPPPGRTPWAGGI